MKINYFGKNGGGLNKILPNYPNPLYSLENRILHFGREIFKGIPKTRLWDYVTLNFWRDKLIRFGTGDEELCKRLFGLVRDIPIDKGWEGFKILEDEIAKNFPEDGTNLPWIIELGVHKIPAVVFSPFFHQSVREIGKRFIAGSTLTEAMENIGRLQDRGIGYTLDILGEAVSDESAALKKLQLNIDHLEKLANHYPKEKGPAGEPNCSIKLTGLTPKLSYLAEGLRKGELDEKELEVVRERVRQILRKAKDEAVNGFVRIDMEKYEYKDISLKIFKDILMEEEFAGCENLGIVIQTYLVDAEKDVIELISWAKNRFEKFGSRTPLRIVKGAYNTTDPVWAKELGISNPIQPGKAATDANFEKISERLIQNYQYFKLAWGSHYVRSLATVLALAEKYRMPNDQVELQMLYGMGEPILAALKKMGYGVRVYVPYGDLETGMAYLVRRLIENTSGLSCLVQLMDCLRGKISPEEILKPPRPVPVSG